MKPKFIILEGPNGSGKSTLKKNLADFKNEQHVVVDRGILSNIVYHHIYNRPEDEIHCYNKMLRDFLTCDNFVIVVITASIDELKKRRPDDKYLEQEKLLFDALCNISDRIIRIDNTDLSTYGTYHAVLDKLEEFE